MKLCKDCAHWHSEASSTPSNNLDKCVRIVPPPVVSLVTGEPVPAERVYCELERRDYHRGNPNHCGPEGRFWVAAEPPQEVSSDPF